MIDLVKLVVKAGDGGHGRISFRREKYIPKGGPDGGRGGKGGDIIIRLNPGMGTLQHLAGLKEVVAKKGESGSKRQQIGGDAEPVVIEVPAGTVIWLLAENKVSQKRRERYGVGWKLKRSEVGHLRYHVPQLGHAALEEPPEDPIVTALTDIDIESATLVSLDKQSLPKLVEINAEQPEVVIAQGGFGGQGNESFKSSLKTTPLEAEYGSSGEQKIILLEQRLLADVGLVGFPNAGKSTLLSRLTNAHPKIANYPFTTLEPQLGVFRSGDGEKEVVMADIPGLIPDAHAGKGLGITFLKHLEHCQMLVYVLALEDAVALSEEISDSEKVKMLQEQLGVLQHELGSFNEEFLSKSAIVLINKIDIYSAKLIDAIKHNFIQQTHNVILLSSITGEGLKDVKTALLRLS